MHFLAQNEDSVVQLVVGTAHALVSSVSGIDTTEFVSEMVWAAHPIKKSPIEHFPDSATARNE